MATLESRRDMGHVPTPDPVVRDLAAWLACPAHVHAIDPCCGTGAAFRAIVPEGNLYGIELSMARAMVAKKRLTKVIAGDALNARISHASMGLVFCNPPYDDSTEGRLELRFLERATNWLVPGGVLVYIIKQDRYAERILKLLQRNYSAFRHWRFPDPFYSGPELAYGQTVLVCRRSGGGANVPLHVFAAESLGLIEGKPLPAFGPPHEGETIRVPPGEEPSVFISGHLSPDDLADLLKKSPLTHRPPVFEDEFGRPPLPLEDGHVALLLASGAIDGIFGSGPTLHASKGTVTRTIVEEQKFAQASENTVGHRMLIETKTDTFQVQIRAIQPDGQIHNMTGAPLVPKDEDATEEDTADAA